ncbi:glycosyltransferase family 4 protein [Parasphingopyxis sp. CP4]|uniref:hypothetical protein n=1 Tax=Parasphingopyxis sp. CP4 TaxID=2724527 RepID=UPI0015A46E18|nr:hypothetical protein [Parasphingopyxis sp. CP4]QLC21058.1 glycosyltransferase family 4 protein [Parasphingopyxis sp. CP4]
MIEEEEISDTNRNGEGEKSLESQLSAERRARESAEREIVSLKTEKQALEYRVINANRTLAYGLGRALIEARTLKGFFGLPGKIRRLRSKQRAKRRERVPNSFDDDISARLKLVEPALEKAANDGAQAALDWLMGAQAGSEAQARALAEIAHWVLPNDPDMAGSAAVQAVQIDPGEARLFSLAQRLQAAGQVRVPALLCGAIESHQSLSALDHHACNRMIEDGEILEQGEWRMPGRADGNHDSDGNELLLLCPARWQSLSQVTECRTKAEAAGLTVTVASSFDTVDLEKIDIVHIFATSIAQCSDDAVSGLVAGCRLIIDISNPPSWQGTAPDSERAIVEQARLVGLGAGADQLIARSIAAARFLEQQDIDHVLVDHHPAIPADPVGDGTIDVAFLEYGIRSDGMAIGIAATLSNDPAMIQCLEACASLGPRVSHIVIFGKGDATVLATAADRLGVPLHVDCIGLPPPQRWRALLAGIDLMVFPSGRLEPLGSEIPAILNQAIADQRRVLASQAAWDSQGSWQMGSDQLLLESGNWADQIKLSLENTASAPQAKGSGRSIADVYAAFSVQS